MAKNPDLLRFACWDIEATGLRSTYNRMITSCFKFSDEDTVRSKSAVRYKDEPALLKWTAANIAEADVIVTWNGKLFDMPFLNGRLMMRGLNPVPPPLHADIMYQARKLRMTSSRLEHVTANFGTKDQKFDVVSEEWVKAADGNVKSHALIRKHCEHDVIILEQMFRKLKPLMVRITR